MFIGRLITVAVFLLTYIHANELISTIAARELGLSDIPACGIQCMILTIPTSGCSLDDTECVCNNRALAGALASCMLDNCTMADTHGTVQVQADICNLPDESKRTELFLVCGIVYAIAFLLVVLRIVGKVVSKRLAVDDYVVVATLLLCGIPFGCVLAMTSLGFGQHMWSLKDGRLLPILRYFLIASSTYVLVLAMIKVSLILFYLDIFKTPRFQIFAYILFAYICVNSLVIFFLTIFSCIPVQSFWNRDIKGKCLDVQALAYVNSACAIAQDVMLLVLPLLSIRKLQMQRNKKVAVGLMFCFGTFGCIATIVRLHTLLQFKISIDPTWDYAPATTWTVLELAAGIACVSLPSIRILLVHVLPVRIKQILTNITHSSENRRAPASHLSSAQPRRGWKKPSTWMSLSHDSENSGLGSSNQDSVLSRVWPRDLGGLTTHARTPQDSQQPVSALSYHYESGVLITHPPSFESRHERNERITRKVEAIEMLKVPNKNQSKRPSLKSNASRESELTALPAIGKIGCLPDDSYSDIDVRREFPWVRRYMNKKIMD